MAGAFHGIGQGKAGQAPAEEGYPHAGKVDFLDNQVARSTGTIRVRALLDNADRQFTPGLFARVQLLGSGQFQAMLIDDKAVLTDQDRNLLSAKVNTLAEDLATLRGKLGLG